MTLSATQVDTFRNEGVLLLGRVLSEAQVQGARERLEELMAKDKFDKPGSADGKFIWRRLNVSQFDPWFKTLVREPNILDIAESVLGPNIQYYQDNIFYKPAAVGDATPWHQDNIWWHSNPPNMLTIWIALDPANEGNGAVQYVRGSNAAMIDHTLPIHDPGGFTFNVIDPVRIDKKQLVSFDLPPGHGVMHHCQTIHGSPANTSDRPRRGYTIHLMQAGLTTQNLETNPILRGKLPEPANAA